MIHQLSVTLKDLYVGKVTKLALPAGTLTEPGGIAFDRRANALVVSNKGTHATDGEVLRIRLPKH